MSLAPGDPFTHYTVGVWCPRCGADLHHVASGTPGMDTRAVARCEPCKRLWGFVLELRDVTAEVDLAAEQAEAKAEATRQWRKRQKADGAEGDESGERAA